MGIFSLKWERPVKKANKLILIDWYKKYIFKLHFDKNILIK